MSSQIEKLDIDDDNWSDEDIFRVVNDKGDQHKK